MISIRVLTFVVSVDVINPRKVCVCVRACVRACVCACVRVCFRYKILASIEIGVLVLLQIVLTVYLQSDINGDYLRFVSLATLNREE